eukprot:7523103-Pyramimonas_sp.AAC.1
MKPYFLRPVLVLCVRAGERCINRGGLWSAAVVTYLLFAHPSVHDYNPGAPYRPYPTCRHSFNRFFAHAEGLDQISAIGVQGDAWRVDCQPDGKRRVGLCRSG